LRLLKILGYLASTIVIASALILALAGGFYWKQESRWAADRERARLAPGTPIDTPQFHVLAGDQKAYRVDTSSRVLSVNFDGTEFLNPGGDKILPAAADVRSGPMDVEKYTSPGQKSFDTIILMLGSFIHLKRQ